MVKIKTISRSADTYSRPVKDELFRIHRNLDPDQHPFQKAREYSRAINAAKMERMFSKPFVGALMGHKDGISTMAKHPKSLSTIFSGSCDGEVRVWNVSFKSTLWKVQAHQGFVRGLTPCYGENDSFLSCGEDKTIKLWSLAQIGGLAGKQEKTDTDIDFEDTVEPKNVWLGKQPFSGIDHQRKSSLFATSSVNIVEVWDREKSSSVRTLQWGVDTISSVIFNPVETDIFATTVADRTITLFDLRGKTPIRKVILQMKSNCLAWNPMEAYSFTVANEDHNLYTWDIRQLKEARQSHRGHVSAVMSVDYSPTGREFCSGGYDCMIRIFDRNNAESRDIYHLKRMQRVSVTKFTNDSRFILSGSDDTNIRVWKANASEPLGLISQREKVALEYRERVKQQYATLPDVQRIIKQRRVPKPIKKATMLKGIIKKAADRRLSNKIAHSKPGSKILPDKATKRVVVSELT